MPYFKKGKPIPRVTEVISSGECSATAFIERKFPRTFPRSAHTVALAGTLVHSKIQRFSQELMGEKGSGLTLNPSDEKLFAKVFAEHKKRRKKGLKGQSKYETMTSKVNDCFANFLAFYADKRFVPLMVEKRLFSKKFNYGGTVDLVALFKIRGSSELRSQLPGELPKKKYWVPCECKGPCSCVEKEVVVVLDWKSSTRKQEGHRIQMSAYFQALEEIGSFDKLRKKGYDVCWLTYSVLLGVHSLKRSVTPYQLHRYDPDFTDFFTRCGTYHTSEYVSRDLKGKLGLKGRCMFCSYLHVCPDRVTWSVDGDLQLNTFFTTKELEALSFSVRRVSKTVATALSGFEDLKVKVDDYLERAKRGAIADEKVIKEVYVDFEKRFGIPKG